MTVYIIKDKPIPMIDNNAHFHVTLHIRLVAVPGRNQHYSIVYLDHVAVAQNFHFKGGAHADYVTLSGIPASSLCAMSPTIKGIFGLQGFERGNEVNLCNGIMFDLYPGLPHL